MPERPAMPAGGPSQVQPSSVPPSPAQPGESCAEPQKQAGPGLYLPQITGLFTGLLIISNVCSNRLVAVGPLEFDAGTLMFPLTYIFGDLLTEVYGFQKARRVIWTGFAAIFLCAGCLWLAAGSQPRKVMIPR